MILVTGATGQVGSAWLSLLGPARAVGIDYPELDLRRPPAEIEAWLEERFTGRELTAVVHPAAYTQVDLAEKETALAHAINVDASGAIARWAARRGLPLVSYSTDYVYPGQGTRPWRETDAVEPLSAYGRTKLDGEKAIFQSGVKHLIFRTSWVYDESGKNFLNTMLRLGAEREELRVVADQHGAPTYAPQLAEASYRALENACRKAEFPTGVYHLCHGGETTWHGFAQAIFAGARALGASLKVREVFPILTADYPTPAKRPANSRLNTELARERLSVTLPDWAIGLRTCLERKFPR